MFWKDTNNMYMKILAIWHICTIYFIVFNFTSSQDFKPIIFYDSQLHILTYTKTQLCCVFNKNTFML